MKMYILQTMCPESSFWIVPNWPQIGRMTMASQFANMTKFFDVVLFFLSGLVTGRSFMSILSLVLVLRPFIFIGDSPEIQKSEIHSSEFCPISGDWDELGYQIYHGCP